MQGPKARHMDMLRSMKREQKRDCSMSDTPHGQGQRPAMPPLVPVLVCSLAILILSGMDAAMKSLVIAIGVYNTVMWRSLFATTVSAIAWSTGPRRFPPPRVLRLHLFRALVIALILLSFFWGLARLPMAEAIGLSFIAPLIALFLAAVLLGEKIGKQAIWASAAGLAGVIIITAGQMGQAHFTNEVLLGTLAILASTVGYAYNLILGRQQAQLASPTEIMFFQNMTLSVLFLLPAPWLAVALPQSLWLPIAGVTVLSLSGQYLMTWSYARAEAQYLIPTEYSAFIWAIALGWYFFDESVGWATIAGAALIIVGCLIAARSKPELAEPIEATL